MDILSQNDLNSNPIRERFRGFGIELYAAGRWRWDEERTKHPVDPNRKDGIPLEQHPSDNMTKHRAEQSGVVVIDNDGGDIEEVYNRYPTCRHTFYTTTSKHTKQHFYLYPPEGKVFTRGRKIKTEGTTIDVLTTGIIFEGHDFQSEHSCFTMSESPIYRCTQAEFEAIESLDAKAATKKRKAAMPAPPRSTNYQPGGTYQASDDYNAQNDAFELLQRYGYTQIGNRLLYPDSESGIPGVVQSEDGKVYSHGGDWLNDGRPHDAWDIFVHYEHNGDRKAAYKVLMGETMAAPQTAQPNQPNQPAPTTWGSIIATQAMTKEDWKNVEDMKFYIDRFAHETGILMLSAKPGAAKSWLAYMIANRIMEDRPEVMTVFIDQDSGAEYNKKRSSILKERHGERHGESRFEYISQVKTGLDETFKLIEQLSKVDLHRKIVILDSLLSLMRKGSIKNDDDVREIMDACESLRNAGALVILITHDKKAKDENGKGVFAGSVRIEKSVDAYFAVSKTGDIIECECSKLRGAEKISRSFKVESFEGMIATDEDYLSAQEQKDAGRQQANDITDEKVFNMISNAEHLHKKPLTITTLKAQAKESNPSISTRQTGYSFDRLVAAKRIFEESIGANNTRLLRTAGQSHREPTQ